MARGARLRLEPIFAKRLVGLLALLCLAGCLGWTEAAAGQPETPQQAAEPVAAPRGKKLVLKDGSFHIVRSYERRGERVRYYSVERSAWEEIPSALVDWEATRRAEAEVEDSKHKLVEKMKTTEAAARAGELDVDASIEVAPGVFLPDGEGLYVVERGVVLPLSQVGADVKLDKGRLLTQILVPVPVVPTKHTVQVPGKRAVVRITNPEPEFYFRTADAREPEVQLIRATPKGKNREIQVIQTNLVGQRATRHKAIATQRWKAARGVYRLTMSEPLAPGEYALAEFLPDEGMNLYVWDFGLDPPLAKPARK